jgi:hypothetical protein
MIIMMLIIIMVNQHHAASPTQMKFLSEPFDELRTVLLVINIALIVHSIRGKSVTEQ